MRLAIVFLFSMVIFRWDSYAQLTERSDNRDQWLREGKDPSRRMRLASFSELKFGMFIHWGLYAKLGGEWKGITIPSNRPYAEQINLTFKIPNNEYELLATVFNPTKFDANEWVKTAKDAGMQYLVFTAKHQEGFSMFDSPCSTYDIVDATPFKRDPIRELADACKKEGIKLGLYYSNARDFHESGANWNTNGNTWDFASQTEEDFEAYFYGKVFCEVRALLTQYGDIELMWFDVPYKLSERLSRDLKNLVTSIQPNCLVNSRIGNGYGDYISLGDNEIAGGKLPQVWETCMTINNTWGYSKHDSNWKSPNELIHQLIDVTAKGGNYLLNIGPMGNGRLPDTACYTLKAMGKWLTGHKESIMGTSPAPVKQLSDQWRCTMNGSTLYLHVLDSLCTEIVLELPFDEVTSVVRMEDGTIMDYSCQKKLLKIPLSSTELVDPYATVFEIYVNNEK